MIYSMTASGQSTVTTELGELNCELRGVNHRFLDIAPRMPEELRVHETELRELIGSKLSRGRVDCFIRLKETESAQQPNADQAAALQHLLSEMQAYVPSMEPIRAIDVLRWPGVLQPKQVDPAVIKQQLFTVVEQALDSMVSARAKEGSKMAELIEQRLDTARAICSEVEEMLPQFAEQYRARLEEKLGELKDQLDPARVEQEILMFLQKTDVAEELDRLRVHCDEVNAVLKKPEPAGRRLDFLMQELNREANTLGSKSQDARLTKASVDLKVLIEQMREQVQNIE